MNWAMNGGTAAECAALAAVAAPDRLFESDRERLLTPTPLFTKLVSAAVLVLADDERANAIFDELETGAHWSGAPHALMGANIWRGFDWARRGELAEAEACLRAALEVMKLWSVSGGRMSHAFGLLADVLVERGELAAARRVLAERPDASGGEGEAVCRYAELKLLVAESRFEEALEAADAYGELFGGVVQPGVDRLAVGESSGAREARAGGRGRAARGGARGSRAGGGPAAQLGRLDCRSMYLG